MLVHYRNDHGFCKNKVIHCEDNSRSSFALVIVYNPKYKKYLVVQEYCKSGYWLPAGRLDPGESY